MWQIQWTTGVSKDIDVLYMGNVGEHEREGFKRSMELRPFSHGISMAFVQITMFGRYYG